MLTPPRPTARLPRSLDPRRRVYWMLALIAVSVGLIVGDQSGILQPVSGALGSVASSVMGGTQRTGRNLRNIGTFWNDIEGLRAENERLRSENEQLKISAVELQTRRNEIEELQAQLHFKENRPDLTTIPADVVLRDFSGSTQSLVISKGQEDGLRCLQPILSPTGLLVGQIIELRQKRATVLLLTDVSSTVNVSITPSLPASVVGSINGAPPLKVPGDGTAEGQWQVGGRMIIRYIDRSATIKRGDWVITSGLGATFPRDLIVGQVDTINETANKPDKEATLTPLADFSHLTSVLALDWNSTVKSPAVSANGTPVPTTQNQTGVCKRDKEGK